MAAPTYTTDLNVLNDFEGVIPPLGEFTGYAAGRAPAESQDYPIQGTWHIDDTLNAIGHGSIGVDNGSNITWTSGWAMFAWIVWTAPIAINTQANGGLVFMIGSALTAFNEWWVGGSDFGSYPYGGWQCFAVDPEITYSAQTGAPGTNYRWVGGGVDCITKVAKGSPLGVDVIRYGRGELRVAGGQTANYASFTGMATANDGTLARWGLFQAIEGAYKWKGLMYLGYGALTEFTDSNKNIVVDNTEFVVSDFNKIEIHDATSIINWTNINISALGTVSKGDLEMIDNAEFNDTGGTFTDMNSFIYQPNATLTGRIFRRCGQVTQGGGVFDGCIFEESFAAVSLLADDLDNIDNCSFKSDGSNHAIELTEDHAGGTYTLTGCTYTGYAASNGSTGNEVIFNDSTGHVIINVVGGDAPTIRNGLGATTALPTSVTLTMTVKDEDGAVVVGAYAYIDDNNITPFIMNTTTNASGVATVQHTGGAAPGSMWRVRKYGFRPYKQVIDIAGADISIPVTLINDPQQT